MFYQDSRGDLSFIYARLEEIRLQLMTLTELTKRTALRSEGIDSLASHPLYGGRQSRYGIGAANEIGNGLRLRESDTHIFLELYLPQLSIGEVDVEVSGNRVVCRTRIPVNFTNRWWALGQLPRGLEVFELNDGRVEFNWVAPVAIQAKEVDASLRSDGFLCVCIPKAETTARHTVKIVKENTLHRKSAGDMNS